MTDVTPEAPTMSMRVYFSSYHLWAARRFVALARAVEGRPDEELPRFDIEQRAYVTNAILSAVAFLEAAINEIIKDVVDQHESYISPIPADVRTLIQAFWN